MAEQDNPDQSAVAEQPQDAAAQSQEKQEDAFEYPIQLEETGPATKRVTIEIPAERIESKLKKQFTDLRREVAIPGFRPGHAPQKLVEKRFHAQVADQVRRDLVSESYQQALEKNSLQVIGDPTFENAEDIKLPESGPLKYSFSVEVQPKFTLPELKGLNIRRPTLKVTDENIELAMTNLRQQQGVLSPVEGRGAEAGDYLTADVHVKVDGNVVSHQHDAPLVVRPGRVAGIYIEDLDKQLAGLKSGQDRVINAKAPDTHPTEAMRGKDVQIEVALKDIKKLELPEVNADFLSGLGFEDEKELREALREQMQERVESESRQAMREQVNTYLLDKVQMELPSKLSERQADRVVRRRMLDLMMRGVEREQLEAATERLKSGAAEEAARELKLFFILQEMASQSKIDVSEGELNSRISMLAIQNDRRPEKMKQEMSRDGSLMELYIQIREEKAVDQIIEQANVEEVAADAGSPASGGAVDEKSADAPAADAGSSDTNQVT